MASVVGDGGFGDFLIGVDGEEAIVGVGVMFVELFIVEMDGDVGDLRKPEIVVMSCEGDRAIVDGLMLEIEEDFGDRLQEIGVEMKDLESFGIDEGGALEKDGIGHVGNAKFAHGIRAIEPLLKSDFVSGNVVPREETFAAKGKLIDVTRMEDENERSGTGRSDMAGETGHTRRSVAVFIDREEAIVERLDHGDVADLVVRRFFDATFTVTTLEIHPLGGCNAIDALNEFLNVGGDAGDDLVGGTLRNKGLERGRGGSGRRCGNIVPGGGSGIFRRRSWSAGIRSWSRRHD